MIATLAGFFALAAAVFSALSFVGIIVILRLAFLIQDEMEELHHAAHTRITALAAIIIGVRDILTPKAAKQ